MNEKHIVLDQNAVWVYNIGTRGRYIDCEGPRYKVRANSFQSASELSWAKQILGE